MFKIPLLGHSTHYFFGVLSIFSQLDQEPPTKVQIIEAGIGLHVNSVGDIKSKVRLGWVLYQQSDRGILPLIEKIKFPDFLVYNSI